MNWLTSRRVALLVYIGGTILARVRFDPRLNEATSLLDSVQRALEARARAWEDAAGAARDAVGNRKEMQRDLVDALRDFGFTILSFTRNHHGVDPYRRYFPSGYGSARQLNPLELVNFTRELLFKLESETEPRLLAGREPIVAALNALMAAEDACQAALQARTEVFGALQAEKRAWVRGMKQVRTAAEAACFYDRPYLKSIFAPLLVPRKGSVPEEEPEDSPEKAPQEALPAPEQNPGTETPGPSPEGLEQRIT